MMKKFICILLISTIVSVFLPTVYANEIIDSGKCGSNLTWELDDNGTLIISGTGAMENYYWYPAPWGRSDGTYGNDNIKKVIIEEGVTEIGGFSRCYNLISVDIAGTVTYIQKTAFWGCDKLQDINIPANVRSIGANAFNGCEKLSHIDIPTGINTIQYGCFFGCSGLTEITIPNNIIRIEEGAFNYIPSLTINYEDTRQKWNSIDIHKNNDGIFNNETIIHCTDDPSVPSEWATDNINSAAELGLIPEELQSDWQTPITRLDFCKLARTLCSKFENDSTIRISAFNDIINLSSEEQSVIGYAEQKGIVSGYEDGTFRPYNEITRQEAAVMLMNTAQALGLSPMLEQLDAHFVDCENTADWAMTGIKYVYNQGIMSGTDVRYESDGLMNGNYYITFEPLSTYTREQAMVTFYRLYQKLDTEKNSGIGTGGSYTGGTSYYDRLKNYEKALEKYKKAVEKAVDTDEKEKELKQNMKKAMKEHWILSDFKGPGSKNIPDEVYEALYMFTNDLPEFKVISKDHNWTTARGLFEGCLDMTVTPLSNIGHGKRSYSVDGTIVTIDAATTLDKNGFGTVSWGNNSAMFSANPNETLSTVKSLIEQSIELVIDIYSDELQDVAKELKGYGTLQEFLQSDWSRTLNKEAKKLGLGDLNKDLGFLLQMYNLASSLTMSDSGEDILKQMQKLESTDLLSDTTLTDAAVKQALQYVMQCGGLLIDGAKAKVYGE